MPRLKKSKVKKIIEKKNKRKRQCYPKKRGNATAQERSKKIKAT